MDPLMVSLRILHVLFGVVWAGSTLFLTFFLEPKLRALGPAIQRPVMKALIPVVSPTQMASSFIVIGTGIAIALIMRWNNLDRFLSFGWGWAILVGFTTGIASAIVGFGLITPVAIRIDKLVGSIQGRAPTPEEAGQLGHLAHRLETLSRITAVLIIIAIGAMAAARYV